MADQERPEVATKTPTAYFERGGLLVPPSVIVDDLEADGERFLGVIRAMVREPIGVEINTTTWKAYVMFSALQLSSTHPDLGAELRDQMIEIGEALQALVEHSHPELAPHMATGWHRELDAPRRRLPEEVEHVQ